MDKKPQPNRGRKTNLSEVKLFITATSITATLVLWNLFSRPASLEALAATAEPDIPLVTDEPVLVLDLPPMPTLIPPLSDSALDVPLVNPSTNTVVLTQNPLATGKILLGGSQPGGQPQVSNPNRDKNNNKPAAARTRSSN
jgi:hypothetical protein